MGIGISVKELMRRIDESEKTRTQEARILDSKGNFVRKLFSQETLQKTLAFSKKKS